MFKATDTPWAPWYVVHSDDKKRARLNIISHLLKHIPYEEAAAREGEAAGAAEGARLQGAGLPVQVRSGADVAIRSRWLARRGEAKFDLWGHDRLGWGEGNRERLGSLNLFRPEPSRCPHKKSEARSGPVGAAETRGRRKWQN